MLATSEVSVAVILQQFMKCHYDSGSRHMKALEFDTTILPGGQIMLPHEVAGQIPAGEHLRVILMWEPSGANSAGRQRFESAYCPADAVYEQLIDEIN